MFFKLLSISFVGLVTAAPFPNQKFDINNATEFLSLYGYMPHARKNETSIPNEKAVIDGLHEFQEFYHLNITDTLDKGSISMMEKPRCGVEDKISPRKKGEQARFRRYTHEGGKWRVSRLTYKVSKYPSTLSKQETDKQIERAFQTWSNVTPLRFSPAAKKPTIDIKFEKINDTKIIGRAYSPIDNGNIIFNDGKTYTANSNEGINLVQAAVHEIGHSLGLGHSNVEGSIMYSSYGGYKPNMVLHSDDIEAIQVLYGAKGDNTDVEENDPTKNAPKKRPNGRQHSIRFRRY